MDEDESKRVLYERVNEELGKLSDWLARHELTLNYSKMESIDNSKLVVGDSSDRRGEKTAQGQ